MEESRWWLDQHAGSVTAALTAVLAFVTWRYVHLTNGLLTAARLERADRLNLQRSEQARSVGGYLTLGAEYRPNYTAVYLNLVNASQLPVRNVAGEALVVGTEDLVGPFPVVAVLEPGTKQVMLDSPTGLCQRLFLRLEFDDDAGTRWRKYASVTQPLVPVGVAGVDPENAGMRLRLMSRRNRRHRALSS